MLAQAVYEAIKATFDGPSISLGARINIDMLGRELEVSNTPVSEALTHLEAEGLVVRKSLFGFQASSLFDRGQVRELYTVRLLLEPAAAQLAARSGATPAIGQALEEIHKRLIVAKDKALDRV